MPSAADDLTLKNTQGSDPELSSKPAHTHSRSWARLLMWALSLAQLICTLLLAERATYAWGNDEVRNVSTAELKKITKAGSGTWLKVTPHYAAQSTSFSRFFESGSFRVVQDQTAADLYYVLRVPQLQLPFLPPRRVSGRLLTLKDAPLADFALVQLMKRQSETQVLSAVPPRALLLEGETPRSLRWSIPSTLFSGLLTLFFALLAYRSFKKRRVSTEGNR